MSRTEPFDEQLVPLLAAADHRPVVVHVVGPRGSGRTHALDSCLRWARERGWACLHSTGSSRTRTDPFGVVDQLVTALHQAEPRPVTAAAVANHLAEALRAAAADRPVLMVVDDVDLVDPDSVGVISWVVRNLVDQRIAIVSASATAAPWPSPSLVTVRLDPWAEHEIVGLLLDNGLTDRVARRCSEWSGGNPGMALALAAGLSDGQRRGQDPLPSTPHPVGSLAEEIRQRLAGLGDRVGRALVVSAADRGRDPAVIRRALHHLGEDESSLDEAEAEGVVDLIDGRIVFPDPWTSLVAPSLVAPASRRAAHRALARAHDRPEQAAARAWHLAAAADGPDTQASTALALVAHDQARRGALRAAVETALRAADLAVDAERRTERQLDALAWSLDAADTAMVRHVVALVELRGVVEDPTLDDLADLALGEAGCFLRGSDPREVVEPVTSPPSDTGTWEQRWARRRTVRAALDAGDHRTVLEVVDAIEHDPLGEGLSTVAALRHAGEIRRSRAMLLSTTSGAPFADPAHVIGPDAGFATWFALLCAADLAVLVGRGDDAERLLSANDDRVPAMLRDWARVVHGRAALQQDPTADARAVPGALLPFGAGALLEVRRLIETGVGADDVDTLDEAIELATASRLPVEAAEARLWALPLRPAAVMAEQVALTSAVLERLGIGAWSRRVSSTTNASATSPRPNDPAIEALSAAERRVADAVANGLTNRETAAALVLSVKTVDFHLQQIYRKLGIRSRTELTIRIMNASPSDPSPPNSTEQQSDR